MLPFFCVRLEFILLLDQVLAGLSLFGTSVGVNHFSVPEDYELSRLEVLPVFIGERLSGYDIALLFWVLFLGKIDFPVFVTQTYSVVRRFALQKVKAPITLLIVITEKVFAV